MSISAVVDAVLSIALMVAIFVAFLFTTDLWKATLLGKIFARKSRRSPLKDDMLRHPGQQLAREIDDLSSGLFFKLFMLITITIAFVMLFGSTRPMSARLLLFLAFAVIVVLPFMIALRKTSKKLFRVRLGYDGELATGEELNQLMRRGYYVFHDLVADTFNIDHIVIGPSGVYAVETKARAKPNEKGSASATVKVEESILKFPKGRDEAAIQQARNQAQWLCDFLRSSVGIEVPVFPVVALPGWFVENGGWIGTGKNRCLVFNPKGANRFIGDSPEILTSQLVKQAAFQVEQKCRTVKPWKVL